MLLSIVLPVYNERDSIEKVIDSIESVKLDHLGVQKEIIVVDDNSINGTYNILRLLEKSNRVSLLHHSVNAGKGGALRTGIEAARGEIILFQDADFEYDPREYPKLLKPLLDNEADVVYGSRFISGRATFTISKKSYLANRFLTYLSNIFTGLRLTDMETGFKVFKASVIKNLDLKEERFGIEPEITVKIARQIKKKQIRLKEVSISYNARTTSMGKKIGWKDGLRAIFCIIKYKISM